MKNQKEGRGFYNLESRTIVFAEKVVDFCKSIKKDAITAPLITQLVKSAGSQAANYYEATEAESQKDFYHKIAIANKETKESKVWLQLLAKFTENDIDNARKLWKEANELNLIFASIRRKRNLKFDT